MGFPKRKFIFQPSILRGYVCFREGTCIYIYTVDTLSKIITQHPVAIFFISWEFHTFIPSQKHEKDIHPCVDLSGFCIKYINGQNRKESIQINSEWYSTLSFFWKKNIKWSNNCTVSPLPYQVSKWQQKLPKMIFQEALHLHQVVGHKSCKKVSTRKQWSAYLTNPIHTKIQTFMGFELLGLSFLRSWNFGVTVDGSDIRLTTGDV